MPSQLLLEMTKTSSTPVQSRSTDRGSLVEVPRSLRDALAALDWPEWYRDAACRSHHPIEFFGEDKDEHTSKHAADMSFEEVERAKAVCGDCPVMEECREYALINFIDYGVWGQMTHRERLAWWRSYGSRRFLRKIPGFRGPFAEV